MGVSVEKQAYTYRIDDLRRTGAKIKFLSLEPLLGLLGGLNLNGIAWLIVGGNPDRVPGFPSFPMSRPPSAASIPLGNWETDTLHLNLE